MKGPAKFASLLVYLSQSATYLVPLLLIPYLSRTLSLKEVGLYVVFQTLLNYGTAIGEYSFQTVSVNKIISIKDKRSQFNYFLSVLLGKIFVSFGAASIVGVYLVFTHSDVGNYYTVFLISGVLSNIFNSTWLMIAQRTLHLQSGVNLLTRGLNLITCFIFVNKTGDLPYLVASISLSTILFNISTFIISFIGFRRFITDSVMKKLDVNSIPIILREGWSIFSTQVLGVFISNFGVLYLAAFVSRSIIGGYGVIDRVMKAISGFYTPFTQIIYPIISKAFAESYEKGRLVFLRYLRLALLISLSTCVLTMLAFKTHLILYILGSKFIGFENLAFYFIPWLFFGIINNMLGLQYMVNNSLEILYSRIYSFSVLTCLIMTVLFFKLIGYSGIALAISINEVILFIILGSCVYRYDAERRNKI